MPINLITMLQTSPTQRIARQQQHSMHHWQWVVLLITWFGTVSVTSFPVSTPTTRSQKRRSWDDRVQQLVEYKATHGHCRVANVDDPSLYAWTLQVRKKYNNNLLDANKTLALDTIGFCWNLQEYAWEKNYQQLRLYHLIHGNCQVSNTNLDYPGLGIWVRNQRREYRNHLNHQPHTLSPERLAKLELLNFEWSRNHSTTWESNYKRLVEYKTKHGHVNVPQNCSLGVWCINQRTYYRQNHLNQTTALTPARIAKLEQLGFLWHVRNHIWEENLRQLRHYYDKHGTVNIPVSDSSRTYLRLWLTLQRYKYNTQRLSETRIEKLETTIPQFKWRARQRTAPSSKDWANLFGAMRNMGISEHARPKTHWFDGEQRFSMQVKETWTEKDLWELWNSDEEDDE